MAEMLAHEIKNPLAGITGAAQLLAGGLSGEDLELTDLIVEESRRIVKLLEQVEQFGNVRPPKVRPVNVHDVLDRARQSAAVGFGAHMRFVEDYDPSLPRTLADPDQLTQVFLNLIKNACEAGADGGTIRLRSFYEPSLRLRRKDGSRRGCRFRWSRGRRAGVAARHCGRCIRAIRVGARERDGAGARASVEAPSGCRGMDLG
jgi:two-component system nitrogen regulation sensor histidine kinase GlnL